MEQVPIQDEIDWSKIDHFDPEEFDDPDYPGSWVHMHPLTIIELNRIRRATGWKIITHNKYGLHGCVCMKHAGHSDRSLHYFDSPGGCSAVDWHFDTDADTRLQANIVIHSKFKGVGCYYDWTWKHADLLVGFHTDWRRQYQLWNRIDGKYTYLLI